MNIIYNSDKNGVISANNKLLFNITEDLQYFKEKTSGTEERPSVLIVGYNTYMLLPTDKITRDYRSLWVLTNKNININKSASLKNIYFYNYDRLIEEYRLTQNKYSWWIIGGSQIYKLFERMSNFIYHCEVNAITNQSNTIIYKHPDYYKLVDEKIYNNVLERNTKTYYSITIKQLVNNYSVDNYNPTNSSTGENKYLDILHKTMTMPERQTRNGATMSYFGEQIKFNLLNGFPLLTTKKMFFKGIMAELLFFIKGHTDTKELEKDGVNIWKGNTSREFLDKNGFKDYKEGEMGPMYGYQWRKFNDHIDQLENLLKTIELDPYSRRLLMTTYNPEQVDKGVLYPCHSLVTQFYAEEITLNTYYLSVSMYQRSADVFLGLPFNIASTALLLELICHHLTNITKNKYIAKEIIISLGDVHLYKSHFSAALEQIKRIPLGQCRLKISATHKTLEDYEFEDFTIEDYKSYPGIAASMVP
jgi:thymidylate synthase